MSTLFDAEVMEVGVVLRAKNWRLATAESCTGGLIAASCTAVAGASDWFERGFVTYSDESKCELLGVPGELLARHGAVSEAVARAMAEGALVRSYAQIALAVTGVAGPGGGAPGKPVGTVWVAVVRSGERPQVERLQLDGDRTEVRAQTVRHALTWLQALAA